MDDIKTKLIILSLIFLIIGCNRTQQNDRTTNDTDQKRQDSSESSVIYDSSGAIWTHDYNQQTKEFKVKQLRSVDSDTLTGKTLEKINNN